MISWKRTLTILIFVQFVSAVGMSSIFSFLPLYVTDLGSTTGLSVELLSGLVFSAQAFTMMLAAPIWGALADRRGRKLMVARATFGGGFVIFLMAFARSAEELVLLRAVQGLVTGVFSALTALVAASVPRDRMGYALGLLQVGLWGGVSMGPLIGGVIADTWGFQASFVVTAVLLFVAGCLLWWGVDEQFTPRAQTDQQRGAHGFMAAWRHVLAVREVRVTYTSRFLSRLGRTMIFPFFPLLIEDLMHSEARVASITGLIIGGSAAAGTVGAILLGRHGDRIGHRRVLVVTASVAALFYFPLTFATSVWQIAVLWVIGGGIAGGIMPTLSALLASYTEPGEEGAVYGLESAIMAGARAVSPMIGAALVAWFGLRSVYTAAGLIFLAMAFLAGRWLPGFQPCADSTRDHSATPAAAR